MRVSAKYLALRGYFSGTYLTLICALKDGVSAHG